MPVAVDATLVPFGLFKPALQIEVVQRDVHLCPSNKQPRSKAGHDVAKVLPGQVIALLELLLHDLKSCLPLGATPAITAPKCCRVRSSLCWNCSCKTSNAACRSAHVLSSGSSVAWIARRSSIWGRMASWASWTAVSPRSME